MKWLRNIFNKKTATREQIAELVQPKYYHSWAIMPYSLPDPYQEILAMREQWDSPQVIRLCDCHPAFNIQDLYWKPWQGITINQVH